MTSSTRQTGIVFVPQAGATLLPLETPLLTQVGTPINQVTTPTGRSFRESRCAAALALCITAILSGGVALISGGFLVADLGQASTSRLLTDGLVFGATSALSITAFVAAKIFTSRPISQTQITDSAETV